MSRIMDNFGSNRPSRRCVWVNGPIIIGSGPSGLATAACLKEQSVPFLILERANCIASLWQRRTYDRLKLHLPKQFCQLPRLPFPPHYPKYPSRTQFVRYLLSYAARFHISPRFGHSVVSARFDETCGLWRVTALDTSAVPPAEVEFIALWLVAATGENAEKVVPEFQGLSDFGNSVSHVCDYKSGEAYAGQRVLVVGCGNSGMEVSLDLCHHNARPCMVVRNSLHVLPREVYGKSIFELAMLLVKWRLPVWVADRVMIGLSRLVLGNVEKYGLRRPFSGPLELKNASGKTPVLDTGALKKIKSGEINVVPGVKKFMPGKVELVDGRIIEIDSVVFATGYRSNVPSWLQGSDFFSKDGIPKQAFPNSWKGKSGLYAVGFTKKGLSGASFDAVRIAKDIGKLWKEETRQHRRLGACHRRCISQF